MIDGSVDITALPVHECKVPPEFSWQGIERVQMLLQVKARLTARHLERRMLGPWANSLNFQKIKMVSKFNDKS